MAKFCAINQLNIDVVVYPDIINEKDYMLKNGSSLNYQNHFRIGGVKISFRWLPQGKTAWQRSLTSSHQRENLKTIGYPAYPDTKMVQDAINLYYKNHWQILAHANGDAAIDQYLATIETANAQYGQADSPQCDYSCTNHVRIN
jgi:predicted amidohydrolase YtcJ